MSAKRLVTPSPVKSPLRYPGGKSRAIGQILPQIPQDIQEYREPFIGGGSVFLAVKQRLDAASGGDRVQEYWINDLNYDLYCFWLYARDRVQEFADRVVQIKQTQPDGRSLFQSLTQPDLQLEDFDRAVRFFVLNRITFSGTVEAGGYSQQAFEQRFTDSAIDRLRKLSVWLTSVNITQGDYESALLSPSTRPGENVFLFLDPPYFSATRSRLYGVKGALHTGFDHDRFAETLRLSPHRWLLTYDDSPEIRKLLNFAHIREWTLQYGMNNYRQPIAAIGKELLISNYEHDAIEA